MANIFSLDDATKLIISQALDDLYADSSVGGLGKTCRVFAPPLMTPCGNCIFSSVDQKSANYWKTGGPIQFQNGTTCPICNGSGYRAQEVYKDITFLCEVNPRKFFFPIPSLMIRKGKTYLQTKGFLTYLPLVEQCDHLQFQLAIAGISKRVFTLMSPPVDISNIIQGRYFVAQWEER